MPGGGAEVFAWVGDKQSRATLGLRRSLVAMWVDIRDFGWSREVSRERKVKWVLLVIKCTVVYNGNDKRDDVLTR